MITRWYHIAIMFFLAGFCVQSATAQFYNLPLNREGNLYLESLIQRSETPYQTGMKPYVMNWISEAEELREYNADSLKYYYWLTEKLYRSHLANIKDTFVTATIDPLFNFEAGQDLRQDIGRIPFKNTRGFQVEATLGSRVSFQSSFYENQWIVPGWIFDYATASGVVPGQGRHKPYKAGAGFDFAMSSAYIGVDLSGKWLSSSKEGATAPTLTAQFGHMKNFVGDGYRSLLLSDAAFNYPGLKLQYTDGENRFQATTAWMGLQGLIRHTEFTTPEALFKRKLGTFIHFGFNLNSRIQLGLFESAIGQTTIVDSTTAPHFAMYIPLPGLRTALFGFDDVNNVVVGATAKWRVNRNAYVYGQYVVDDPLALRGGFQAGIKVFEPFKTKRLFVLAEYNQVSKHTFAHENILQNYSHYNQPLGHPTGANFWEAVAMVDYEWGRHWFGSLKFNFSKYGVDTTNTNYGTDIFLSDTTGRQQIGLKNAGHMQWDLKIGWKMNRFTRMRFYGGVTNRDAWVNDEKWRNTYVYVGFRTFLRNEYYDF